MINFFQESNLYISYLRRSNNDYYHYVTLSRAVSQVEQSFELQVLRYRWSERLLI